MPKKVKPKVTRNFLSLNQKLDVISFYNSTKCSKRKLAAHFGIGKTQAGEIIKKQDVYLEQAKSNSTECSPIMSPERPGFQIDKYVSEWYKYTKSKNITITGPMIQQKALKIAKLMGNENFKASSGWLGRFQKRHEIIFRSTSKKNKNNDAISKREKVVNKDLDKWETQLAVLLLDYSLDDVYTAGETGLFFQALPDEIASLKDETCLHGNLPSQRLTVLLCASMTGAKEPSLVITSMTKEEGECLASYNSACELECNAMVMMTRRIMTKWLKKLDEKMVEQNRNIILFLHNNPTHYDPKLKNIKIMYFPTDLPTDFQPMNHGIIQTFKMHYRRQVLECLINLREKYENEIAAAVERIDAAKAISWVVSAWENVNKSVIESSFKASGFDRFMPDINQIDYNDPSLNDVAELLYACDSDANATDYVNIDAKLTTEGLENAEFMEILADGNKIIEGMDIEDEVKPEEDLQVKTYSEAMQNLKELEKFYLLNNDSDALSLVNQLIMHSEHIINKGKG